MVNDVKKYSKNKITNIYKIKESWVAFSFYFQFIIDSQHVESILYIETFKRC